MSSNSTIAIIATNSTPAAVLGLGQLVANMSVIDQVRFFFTALYLLLGGLAAFVSAFCVYALLRFKLMSKNNAFLMVGALCVADLTEGAAFIFSGASRIYALASGSPKVNQMDCNNLNKIFYLSLPFAGTTMMIVSLERLFIVTAPITYQIHGTKVIRSILVIDVIICILLMIAAHLYADPNKWVAVCTSSSGSSDDFINLFTIYTRFMPVVVSCMSYIAVVIILRKRSRSQVGPATNAAVNKQVERQQKEIMVTAVTVCAVYILLSGTGVVFLGIIAPSLPTGSAVGALMVQIAGNLFCTNCIVNVYIFRVKNQEMRRAMRECAKELLPCIHFKVLEDPKKTASEAASRSTAVSNAVTTEM